MSWTQIDQTIERVRISINTNALRLLKQFRQGTFQFSPFSPRQKKILTWWCPNSAVRGRNGIIADGSIRSGKTLSMSLSFVFWAMSSFDGQNFAICGKTIGSLRRNVILWLKLMLRSRGYAVQERRTDNLLIIRRGETVNYFYLFGGRDERSQDLIQGITLAGVLFDEVALMPESFVNQATARCSVTGSKWWFNCNPQGPQHWFYVNWIKKCRSLGLLYLHFTMDDNLSLDEEVKARYHKQYVGVFFKRYIRGLWVLAEGLIYANFDHDKHVTSNIPALRNISISVDVGHSNATAFLATGEGIDNRLYCLDEYYHSGKKSQSTKSPLAYAKAFERWVGELLAEYPSMVIDDIWIDPSALGFQAQLRDMGFFARSANNDVVAGIQTVSSLIEADLLRVHPRCKNLLEELAAYSWDKKASERGEDKPIKENDHACDALRYRIHSCKYDWIGRKPIDDLR